MLGQRLGDHVALRLAHPRAAIAGIRLGIVGPLIIGVDADKKAVLVGEIIGALAIRFLPGVGGANIRGIVVPRNIEERHLQLLDKAVEFGPLLAIRFHVARSLDQVADRHDKLRLQEVDLLHGAGKHPGAMGTGAVGNNGELKLGRIGVGLERCPRIFLSGLDVEAFLNGWSGARIGDAAGEHEGGNDGKNRQGHEGETTHGILRRLILCLGTIWF